MIRNSTTTGAAVGLVGPDLIFLSGLACDITVSQIREVLECFGPLGAFDMVEDRETGNSNGYAFCVYEDSSVTDVACAALNGMKIGRDKTLTVRRANQGATEQESELLRAIQRLVLAPDTKVVCFTNAVTMEELIDDDYYQDILDYMRTECAKFGTLINVIIPRPLPHGEHGPGVGKVYLEYADTESASKARAWLHGRNFGGNEVVATFYPEQKFSEGDYSG